MASPTVLALLLTVGLCGVYGIMRREPRGLGNTIHLARKRGAEAMNKTLTRAMKSGDIIMTDEQYEFIFHGKESSGNRTKRAGSLKSVVYWEGGIVPYFIERRDFNQEEYKELTEAMRIYEENTCVKFIEATTINQHYLWFHNTNDGCYSYLGNVRRGKQEVSLQKEGCRNIGTYLHEIGHALGMIHEHQRPDRNQYVHYYPGNVDPFNVDQLDLYDVGVSRIFQNLPYDLGSIMHYELDAFSIDDISPTLGVDNPWLAKFVGRRYSNQLSYGDVKLINMAYQCGKNCPPTKCPNGFLNKKCDCVTYESYMQKTCTNDPTMVEWCYDLVVSGQCNVENLEHHFRCAKACDFCPRFKVGQRAIIPGRSPTKIEMQNMCEDQYIYPALCQKWSQQGKCKMPWMQRYCRKTCRACKSGIGDCPNMFDDMLCDQYARRGLCKFQGEEGDFVRTKCKDSCGICFYHETGNCRNRIADHACKTMDNQRKCDLQPLAAFQSCPSTCNRCDFNAGSCRNRGDDQWCSIQAMKNMCIQGEKVKEIRTQCPKACNTCNIAYNG